MAAVLAFVSLFTYGEGVGELHAGKPDIDVYVYRVGL